MTPRRERALAAALWTLYACLSIAGLGILAEALFVLRAPAPFRLPEPSRPKLFELESKGGKVEELARKRMSRRIAHSPLPTAPRAQAVGLESLVKLTGILDFGGKSPSVAVIELPGTGQAKGYTAGQAVGETGAVVKEVTEFVVLEFERRRYKLTFKGVEEMVIAPVGATEAPKKGE